MKITEVRSRHLPVNDLLSERNPANAWVRDRRRQFLEIADEYVIGQ